VHIILFPKNGLIIQLAFLYANNNLIYFCIVFLRFSS
jgi:hypothetical protein